MLYWIESEYALYRASYAEVPLSALFAQFASRPTGSALTSFQHNFKWDATRRKVRKLQWHRCQLTVNGSWHGKCVRAAPCLPPSGRQPTYPPTPWPVPRIIRLIRIVIVLAVAVPPPAAAAAASVPSCALSCVRANANYAICACPNCHSCRTILPLPSAPFYAPICLLDMPRPSSLCGAQNFSLTLRNWSSEKVKIDFATCVVAATPPPTTPAALA